MNRPTESKTYAVADFQEIKQKVLTWLQSFSTFCFLDNHGYSIAPHTQECIAAAGAKRYIKANAGNALDQLQQIINEKKTWLFGHLSYDIKNELENLTSSNIDSLQFPDLFFFEPEILIRLQEKSISIDAQQADAVYDEIKKQTIANTIANKIEKPIRNRLSKEQYIETVLQLQKHIRRGDCYEINFCQEFFAENTSIQPLQIYQQLSLISPNPFSAFYRIEQNHWLLCASPERFLQKRNNQLLSQPIKGTAQRFLNNTKQDEESSTGLYHSSKDRSENVMIVDLVRNDLAKICKEGSVEVNEIFGIYTFPQVHQMISTIAGKVSDRVSFTDIIRATFPMGSMTGAPKRKTMELIEQYETTRRGIFSGTVGYITPTGDFDLNVVIRSIMYNASQKYLSMQAGSAITFYSHPENEWNECLLKATAMQQALQ